MQTVDYHCFPLRPGDRVLDLGCGEGRHVISAWLEDEVQAVGLDLSFPDLQTAGRRAAEFAADTGQSCLNLIQGSALQLPFPDACFDRVICSEVLEHLPDYAAALAEIRRVLRPGGLLCVSVPRAWPERICWALSRDYHQVPGGHLRIFDTHALHLEIQQAGFIGYHRHGAHALHSPYWWLCCLFWRSRQRNPLVRLYHRMLVWDLLHAPRLTRTLERWLNPVLGKSVVLYYREASES